ncbi:MAG: hypothetical protein CM15mP95_2050 [Alphaproteobacteria bacterium]|nr:MAG: hypothetical protein CM15mP95_2050 [Alphaproteobacteria bacterium]
MHGALDSRTAWAVLGVGGIGVGLSLPGAPRDASFGFPEVFWALVPGAGGPKIAASCWAVKR